MATERQVEANRRNAARSTGPKTVEGKARSRMNSTQHGLAGESADIEATMSAEFADRRVKWAAEYQPVGQAADWAMDRAVAASLRIERCEATFDTVTVASRERARLAWDLDREVEAATIFARLDRDPGLASRQLMTSLTGVGLLIEAWMGLLAILQGGKDWSEAEEWVAMNLLGIAIDLRSGRTMIDAPAGPDRIALRKALADDEMTRLEAIRDESMVTLDEMDRRHAIAGSAALFSKEAKLVLRYERDAWRRYREAIQQVQGQNQDQDAAPVVVAPTPKPPISRQPDAAELAAAQAIVEERKALRAEAMRIRQGVTDQLIAQGFHDEDAWLKELERRSEARQVTDRSQFEIGQAEPARPSHGVR